MLGKGFFLTESHNPNLPPEEWELVAEFTNPGSYSQSFDWGKYKVVLSGAGGSGAAAAQAHSRNIRYANNGSAGEQNETIINVYENQTSLFSFVIAASAQGSYAKGTHSIPAVAEAAVGGVGTGYENGLSGTKATRIIHSGDDTGGYAVAGGSGGGSSSLSVNGVVTKIAKGGNGGGGEVIYAGVAKGGIGGSGGTSNGNGASGGNAATVLNDRVWSNAGANGYARIYKSNLKPEPI